MTGSAPLRPESGSRFRLLLRPLSVVYACGRLAHRGLYDLRIRRRARLPRPVLCVGNMTVGGTGKTPFIIELNRQLRAAGLRPVILSRGYGATPAPRTPRFVSTHAGIEMPDPHLSGDEPLLIARSCPGTPVVICPDRAAAAEAAIERLAPKGFNPDLFLLDDGYQHEAVEKDISLVLWDLQDLPEKSHQLPAGRLREGLAGLRRASAIILTHAEALPPELRDSRREEVLRQLNGVAPGVPTFEAETRFDGYVPLSSFANLSTINQQEAAPHAPASKLLLISGLARPASFEGTVVSTGGTVAEHMAFSDHHRYCGTDLARIGEAARECGAEAAVTTAKDAVKLAAVAGSEESLPPIHVATISMGLSDESGWRKFLKAELEETGLNFKQNCSPQEPRRSE